MSKNKTEKPTMQDKKIKTLLDKGGYISALTVHIEMPDGKSAEVDRFGRVKWIRFNGERDVK